MSAASNTGPPPGEPLLAEYVEESTFLWLQRASAVSAPNYSRQQFADLDERLEAHIDGLRVGGDEGWKLAEEALDNGGPEDFFPASVLAIESTDDRFARIVARAEEAPEVAPGVISALGWVAPTFLAGRVKALLNGSSPFRQRLGIAACAVHRKDPGAALERYLASRAPAVRSRALRAAGELGRTDLFPAVVSVLANDKQNARFWAAWAAVLLGDRSKALDELTALALKGGPHQLQALQLTLQAMEMQRACELLLHVSDSPDAERLRTVGAGFTGSGHYVPALIEQMSRPLLARVAAEAFVNITGADFNVNQLEAMPPEDFEEGPTEDPDDEDVDVPEDAALPWPDVSRIKSWWVKNSARFDQSTRYFLGSTVTADACANVLRTGFQRQRVLAAHYLCLLNPGTPLFNTSAPAWRQQKLLAEMK
jgi:uncharacterized protein (TIGR02270 family)